MPAFFYRLPVRIYALAAMAVCLFALLTVFLLIRSNNHEYASRERELHQLTDLAFSQLDVLQQQAEAGQLDPAAAREMGRATLEAFRFGTAGDFHAFDFDLVITANAFLPEWVGTRQPGLTDENGVKIYQEMLKIAKAEGQGSLIYHFANASTGVIEAKMGYIRVYEPWGWIVGTGAYVSDIETKVQQNILTTVTALLVTLAVLLVGATLITRSVTGPVSALRGRMQSMADGDTGSEIPATANRSEIGDMARTLDVFRQSLIRQQELEAAKHELDEKRSRVVAALSSKLSALSQGDLTAQITEVFPEDYEQLRRDFNTTAQNLSGTVEQVIAAAASIRNGATEISQASDDLSHRTESQAATLEQTAAALDELTASVKSAAEGARSVEATMEEAKQEARNSGEVVQSAVSAMTEIEESSNKISQIISVIDDIAFQTNLLALNAGVEAARAGEAGRGFAVVASEVRALAQRSSDAAMEIKTLISDSSGQVARGVDLVGKAGDALQSIVSQVTHISQLVSGIAEGAAEQSTGLNEINTGVTQLDQVTQQNAAMVEEATAAGHLLKTDAGKLAELVAHFKTSGGSRISAPAAHAPAPVPTAHGSDDWDVQPAPRPAAAAPADGNAARDLWQDF
ncbi:methyl-accepting chemotaxis protein [Leisingera daeponensis]|uniref:methyl-accepting chemotaxis protein n=1 Tax=Leisingera daeponensis TaxID=405746 RepID=UPI001C976089|nr:methyl-accepting chemotaxis protein [Leisingera daeponensis]MBY6057908.1 cache domain-containing protein [Leisingera daeponensis]